MRGMFGGLVLTAVFVGAILAVGHFSGGLPWSVSDDGESLYDRIGGTDGITVVVDNFVANVAADEMIIDRFAETDIPNLKRLMVEQVCEATGGPCSYSGRSMLQTHTGMGVTEMEFTIIAEHFAAAMDQAGVGQAEKDTIMGVLGSMHDDIVGH